ncbi:glycosyltransferase [Helicobacter sp.]|uniref:glycosyltransferase n=1 Tax=Helicobacter sp. TaxID=218 RepID=UPI0025C08AB9|nr:glycosyltransferase [Helicobacter sp.]
MLYLTERLQLHKNFSNFSIKNANEIVSQDKIFFDNRGEVGIAAFSDYIRYYILYKEGGWWVDTDTICVQNLKSLDMPFVFASERQKDGSIIPTTCVIKAPKGSPMLLKIIQEMEQIISDKKNRAGRLKLENILRFNFPIKVKWGIIGPLFLGDFIVRHKLENYVVDAKYFCDINWFETKNFITPHTKITINKDIYIYISSLECYVVRFTT